MRGGGNGWREDSSSSSAVWTPWTTPCSPLLARISGSHHSVKVSPPEWRMVWLWIEAAAPYAGRLLALPGFLLDGPDAGDPAAWEAGLRLTGHFLMLFAEEHGRRLPEARNRLIAALERLA